MVCSENGYIIKVLKCSETQDLGSFKRNLKKSYYRQAHSKCDDCESRSYSCPDS